MILFLLYSQLFSSVDFIHFLLTQSKMTYLNVILCGPWLYHNEFQEIAEALDFMVCFQLMMEPFKNSFRPGWCGSVGWAPACKPKGHQFNYQSGHMSVLWASWEHARAVEVSLFYSFPSSLSKNN